MDEVVYLTAGVTLYAWIDELTVVCLCVCLFFWGGGRGGEDRESHTHTETDEQRNGKEVQAQEGLKIMWTSLLGKSISEY